MNRLNLLKTLKLRVGLIVLGVIAALALFMTQYFSERLTETYKEAGRAQLGAIASMWDDSFRVRQLGHPEGIQRRINALRKKNPTVHKLSLSWHTPRGGTLLVQSGHDHDPNGTKRDVTTGRVTRAESRANPAPIDAGNFRYHEVRAADGAHYGELNYPLVRNGGDRRAPVAALELHYDLKDLDSSLAADKRTLTIAGVLAALTAALLITAMLTRTVISPLDQLRAVTRRIGGGETAVRLNWKRRDEIGALAGDFDRMAAELESAHGHLEQLALMDPLTGLLNHRAFQERMAEELRRAERELYPVSIVAIDVDNFKEVNDRWGHAAGDQALCTLARSIRAELRPSDVCGRVGGDEFMLAIARTTGEGTEQIVSRLRARIADTQFGPAGESMTISAGISEFPRHSLSQEELMHLADGAMYWAKSNGRNRTFVYSSDKDFALSAQEAADRVAHAGLVNTVHALAKAVDAKDGYTASHSQRVALYAATLATHCGFHPEHVERVRTAGILHDVGKIGISDLLLLQPHELTAEQEAIMRRHSELGRDIIAGAGMDEIGRFVLHLHERFDGGGYPAGISGTEIPLESRILHVSDALEAMTSSRVYRDALPVEVALLELERHAGTQFDPEIVAAMVALVRCGELEVNGGDEQKRLDVLMLRGTEAYEPAAQPEHDHAAEDAEVAAIWADAAWDAPLEEGMLAMNGNGHPAVAAANGNGHGAGPAANGSAPKAAAPSNGNGNGNGKSDLAASAISDLNGCALPGSVASVGGAECLVSPGAPFGLDPVTIVRPGGEEIRRVVDPPKPGTGPA